MRPQFKMSEIVQSQRPQIIEVVTKKFEHLQPFLKKHIHKAAYDAIEGALNVMRVTEDETEKQRQLNAAHKDSQSKATASS